MSDPITTSLLEITSDGAFPGAIQFDLPGGGALTIRGPSGSDSFSLTLPATIPNTGDYLRVNGGGQLYWDAGCSGCGGSTTGGGITDPGANGLLVRTAENTYVTRSIVGTLPITVLNGDGVVGNPTIGLLPGTTPGQVLTWDGTHWLAGAGGGPGPGGGGTPNFLTRWFTDGSTLHDSALSQDATGTTVNAGGAFVVSGRLIANNLFVFPTPTLPFAPPTGEASKALIYYQGGSRPLWVSYSATGGTGGWQPINAFQIGRVPGGSFGLTNKISVGRTGMLVGDRDTTNPGFQEFDSEIYLAPLTSATGDIGKAIVWNGTQWVASPAPIGLAGTGVTVGGAGGQINNFPVWSASNVLINSSPGLIQASPPGQANFLESRYDIFVSDNAIRLGSFLQLDGAFSTVTPSSGGTARIRYSTNYVSDGTFNPQNVIMASINGSQWAPINAITLGVPGFPSVTRSVWDLVPPLDVQVSGATNNGLLRIKPGLPGQDGYYLTWIQSALQWQPTAPGSSQASGAVTTSGGSQNFIPLWNNTNALGNSTLFQNPTGDILVTGALTASRWLKGQFLDISKPIANFPPNQPGVAPDTNTARFVYFGGSSLQVSLGGAPFVNILTGTASGAPITGTPGYFPIFNSSGVLAAGGTLFQDIANGRLTFGLSSPSTSWLCFLNSAIHINNDCDGLAIVLPGAPNSGTNNAISVSKNITTAFDTTFLVTAEGNINIIRRIRYIWPANNPSNNQFLKCTSSVFDSVAGVTINTLNWVT